MKDRGYKEASPLIQVDPCNCIYVDGELKKPCKWMREGGHE